MIELLASLASGKFPWKLLFFEKKKILLASKKKFSSFFKTF
jgi:hypothetical protein